MPDNTKSKTAKIQMNLAETLPNFFGLPSCTVSPFRLRLLSLQADNNRAFDYHEKHSPKVVLTKPKNRFLYVASVPKLGIGQTTETLPITSLPVAALGRAKPPPY
ncbi:hypothetical protein ES703_100233 [subsurface metagenome]